MLHEIATVGILGASRASLLAGGFGEIRNVPDELYPLTVNNPFHQRESSLPLQHEATMMLEAAVALANVVALTKGTNQYFDAVSQARHDVARASGAAITAPQQIEAPVAVLF